MSAAPNMKWYADEAARRVHARLSEAMKPILAELCPSHELSHLGINRNDLTNEVQLRLHLNPIGSVRVVSERASIPPIPVAGEGATGERGKS